MDDTQMKDDDMDIGNFRIKVLREITVISETTKSVCAEVCIILENGERIENVIFELDNPKKIVKHLWNLHPHILLYQNENKAGQNLLNAIRSELPHAKKGIQYHLNRLGTHVINGVPIFNSGQNVIIPTSNLGEVPDIVTNLKYNIDVDSRLSESDAAVEMINAMRLGADAGKILVSYTLLFIMREVYEVAWKAPRFSLFLCDETGHFKTTYVAFITQLHNRSKGIANPERLNASIPKAEELLYEKADCPIVLDDLFPAKFKNIRVQQEKTFLEITRIIADGISRGRKGSTVSGIPPRCGVIFTGEYFVGTGSDAARLLAIQFTSPINDAKLRECMQKPIAISTFYYFFATWYIDNYNTIQTSLEKWWIKYTNTDFGVHKRLREIHFYLNSAYRLFLKYCVEKGFATQKSAERHGLSFENLLMKLVRKQNALVKQEAQPDIFSLICCWYRDEEFKLAKDRKHLKNKDGFKQNGLFCIKPNKLVEKIQQVVPGVTIGEVSRALRSKNALKLDCEGKNYKVGNERFYGIFIDKLKNSH